MIDRKYGKHNIIFIDTQSPGIKPTVQNMAALFFVSFKLTPVIVNKVKWLRSLSNFFVSCLF